MFMRRQFVWWSLHSAGYALSTNLIGTDYIWFCLVLSSSVKLVLIRYGGLRLYWKAIPFFIGLVFGEYAVVTVLNVISIIFQDSDLRSLDIPILVAKATMHKSKGRESKIMLSYQRVKDKRYRNWLSQINAPSPMSSGSEKARRSPSCPFTGYIIHYVPRFTERQPTIFCLSHCSVLRPIQQADDVLIAKAKDPNDSCLLGWSRI